MQKRFAEYYVFGDPATGKVCSKAEAAKLAGYSVDRCRREGSELPTQDTHHLSCNTLENYVLKLEKSMKSLWTNI